MAECILEHGRTKRTLWHLARPYEDERAAEDAWWRGIACHESKGIVLPGPTYDREPTCPDCLALMPANEGER